MQRFVVEIKGVDEPAYVAEPRFDAVTSLYRLGPTW
jgi:hypothetical protein